MLILVVIRKIHNVVMLTYLGIKLLTQGTIYKCMHNVCAKCSKCVQFAWLKTRVLNVNVLHWVYYGQVLRFTRDTLIWRFSSNRTLNMTCMYVQCTSVVDSEGPINDLDQDHFGCVFPAVWSVSLSCSLQQFLWRLSDHVVIIQDIFNGPPFIAWEHLLKRSLPASSWTFYINPQPYSNRHSLGNHRNLPKLRT